MKVVSVDELGRVLHFEDNGTPDERWKPAGEVEAIAKALAFDMPEWRKPEDVAGLTLHEERFEDGEETYLISEKVLAAIEENSKTDFVIAQYEKDDREEPGVWIDECRILDDETVLGWMPIPEIKKAHG